MAPPRMNPGERMAVRLGVRLRRAEVRGIGGELQRRLTHRLEPASAPRPLLQRLARWEGSSMLGWTAGERAPKSGVWFGAPGMVLPMQELTPQASENAPASARSTRGPKVGAVPRQPTSRRQPHAALRRAERRVNRARQAPALHSLWASRTREEAPSDGAFAHRAGRASAAATPGHTPTGTGTSATPPRSSSFAAPPGPRPAPRQAERRATPRPSRAAAPEAVLASGLSAATEAGPSPSFTALDRLEQRAARPVGLVSGDLAWSSRLGHPAARGLAAAQPVLGASPLASPMLASPTLGAVPPEPGRLPEAPLAAHPARGVLAALARAGSPEQVVQTVMERADEPGVVSSLPAPLAEVVKQIRRQVQQAASALPASAGGHIARSSLARQKHEPTAPSAAERLPLLSGGGGGAEVVSLATQRLIRRLKQLVHIAETDRRVLEAQRRVRMAEDSAHARAEASASPDPASAVGTAPVDLDTLGRDVLAAVTHQFQARNERRQEDPDVRNDVWW